MTQLDPREQWIADHADYFVACAFRGRGKCERIVTVSLDGAREAARKLLRDRPVGIYVVAGRHVGAAQALIELIEPVKQQIRNQ